MTSLRVALDDMASDVGSHLAPVLWCVAPTLFEALEGPVGRWRVRVERGRDRILASGWVGARFVSAGEVLFFLRSENQRRTLAPIIEEVPGERRQALGQAVRGIVGSRRDVEVAVRALCDRIPTLAPAMVFRRVAKASRTFDQLDRLRTRPRVVVVSNQHLADHRAVLAWARRREIPSVYVAHAPAADNPLYRDLPVDRALMRSVREVDLYRRWGADPSGCRVVGNPGLVLPPTPPRLDEPPVFAVSPWPEERIRDVIAMVEAELPEVIVAPHPRSSRRRLRRLLPSRWTLSEVPTLQLLARGPRVVIQQSSGVAWESLALGIPTLQIGARTASANYPLIAPPHVLFAETRDELARALEDAAVVDRESLRRWAQEWCPSTGVEAASAAAEALLDATLGEPVLDAWSGLSWR